MMRVELQIARGANPWNTSTVEVDVDADEIFDAAVESGHVGEWAAENPDAVRAVYEAANQHKLDEIAEQIALRRMEEGDE